jgi:Zn-dependent protease with chaperone function
MVSKADRDASIAVGIVARLAQNDPAALGIDGLDAGRVGRADVLGEGWPWNGIRDNGERGRSGGLPLWRGRKAKAGAKRQKENGMGGSHSEKDTARSSWFRAIPDPTNLVPPLMVPLSGNDYSRAVHMRSSILGIAAFAGLWGPSTHARAAAPEHEQGPAATPVAPETIEGNANDAPPVEVPPPSEKAVRYYTTGNLIWVAEQLLAIALPVLLLFTGLSAWLRTVASQLARGRFYPTLVIYLVLLSVLLFLVELPLSYYVGFAREHAYGLSSQRFGKWMGDAWKGLGVGLVIGALVLWVPYWLLGKSPQRWWLWTGMLTLPFYTLTLLIAPLWIAPLFNKFGPMKDKALEATVLETASKAGVEGARVFEVDKSVDTKKVNAYVTGVGGSKRIVLWDTLLGKLQPAQTRFIVGHELGHYVLGHVWSSVLVSSLLTILGLFGAHLLSGFLLARFGARMGFSQLSDIASLPMLMLLLTLFSLVITPAALAFSRYHEHEADRFGLELTHDNRAAATAFVTLQQENLAVPRPGWLFKLYRASHPPIGERVDFINHYRPWEHGQPGRYQSLLKP